MSCKGECVNAAPGVGFTHALNCVDAPEVPVYCTIVLPFVDSKYSTEWHATDKYGPTSIVTRGNFATEDEAIEWARKHLNGAPYTILWVY